MADEMKLRIDGREYPFPGDDLTMDEAIVIFDASGVTLDQLQENMGNPRVMKAIIQIAYQRMHPDADPDTVSALVGSMALTSVFGGDDEDDASPPVSGSSASSPSSDDSTESSGDAGNEPTTAGSPANVRRLSSGGSSSDTPPTSDPTISVASHLPK